MDIKELLFNIDERIEHHKEKSIHINRDGACLGHSSSYWKGRLQEAEEIKEQILSLLERD